jgi:hypothetical protein
MSDRASDFSNALSDALDDRASTRRQQYERELSALAERLQISLNAFELADPPVWRISRRR